MLDGDIDRVPHAHYDRADLAARLAVTLDKAGLGDRKLSLLDLAPLDQFHSRGLASTIELAETVVPESKDKVLDVGSGLGGPSRYLAATYGCQVVGIDLSPSFVEAATFLSARSGLDQKTKYQCANALSLPFPNASFDIVWTQHVAMNIADREKLYGEMHRVMRPGGRLALFDVILGTGNLHFPVPWALTAESSYLSSETVTRRFVEDAGFRVVTWYDKTDEAVRWFNKQKTMQAPSSDSDLQHLNLTVVMGPDFPRMAANLLRNLEEGRAKLLQATFEKS